MSLTLTGADQQRLVEAIGAFVSPLDHADPDDWRQACCEALGALVDADISTFQMSVKGRAVLYSAEVDAESLATYPARVRELNGDLGVDLGVDLIARQLELGVWSRRRFWGPGLRAYYRTSYYNEWVVPVRAFDAIGITVRRENAGPPATVFCHHDRPRGRRFGSRGVRLLELLRPAFEAGVRGFERYRETQGELLRVVDALEEPICLVEVGTERPHRNPAYVALLETEPERDALDAAVLSAARAVGFEPDRGRLNGVDGLADASPVAHVRGLCDSYRVTATRSSAMGARGVAVVSIVPSTGWPPQPAALQRVFGLTAREARVATELARRRTNREIATLLRISPHTARHHTERVLMKLGTRSRNEVRRILLDRL